jgi:diguanylate cyclase (GGDEF)-like protein
MLERRLDVAHHGGRRAMGCNEIGRGPLLPGTGVQRDRAGKSGVVTGRDGRRPVLRQLPAGIGRTGGVRRRAEPLSVLALAILVWGFVASAIGALAWNSYLDRQATRALDSTTTTAASALDLGLQRDAELTASARTLVETMPGVTNSRFAQWFRLLDRSTADPGSFGMLYVQKVAVSQLRRFERRVALDPPLGRPMRGPFVVVPRGATPPFCLMRAGVVEVAPSSRIAAMLSSLLVFTEPNIDYCELAMAPLLEQSARTGRPAAFELVSVFTSTPRLPGLPEASDELVEGLTSSGLIGMLTPVYPGGAVPASPTARAGDASGWILSIYQSSSILAPVLQGRHLQATLSFENPSGQTVVLAGGAVKRGEAARTFRLSGHWNVTLSESLAGAGVPAVAQGIALLCGGLLVSVLLAVLVLVLSRSRARALQLVEVRTAQLRHVALHDDLTGLPNRALIYDREARMIARVQRDCTSVSALFIDLDHFKDVNDTLGHGAGDDLLRHVARRLASIVPETGTVGRLGGDEFVVLLEGAPGSPDAVHLARRLISAVREPFELRHGQQAGISASVGIAEGRFCSAESLLSDADIALYEAKTAHTGQFVVFEPAMRDSITARIGLQSELRRAISGRQLFILYQPTLDLEDEHVIGAEALLRWRHPGRGVVFPGDIIPTLEQTGMIVEVGRYVLFEVCRQAAAWRAAGLSIPVSVNVSGRQLDQDDFPDVVRQALASSNLPPHALTLEITETTLMRDSALSARRLASLKRLGVRIAIDDFGTGYCSLAYLKQFPVDSLKIDRTFVAEIDTSRDGATLVHAIVRLGNDLGLMTVAEGIETPGQLAQLRREGCAAGQGYLFARPLEVGALEQMLVGARLGAPPLERTRA